jgi:hypothetical protein
VTADRPTEYRVISVLWMHEVEQRQAPGVYRSIHHEEAMNEMGRDGWDLVSVTYLPDADRAGIGRNLLVFRRDLPVPGTDEPPASVAVAAGPGPSRVGNP